MGCATTGLEEAAGLKALADCTLGSPCVLGWENTLTVDGEVKYTSRQRGPLASNQSFVETIQVKKIGAHSSSALTLTLG